MDDDLARIVASAAAGLVIRIAGTTCWRRTRDRLAKILGNGHRDREERVTAELDSAANQLTGAERPDRRARARELETELRGSFQTWLRTDPEVVERLRVLVTEGEHAGGVTTSQAVTVNAGIGVMSGRDMTIGRVTNAPGSPGCQLGD